MTSPEPTVRHVPELHAHVVGERCPWCDQPIPREKFDQIKARIQAKERQRSAAQERALREQFAKEQAADEVRAKVALAQAQKAAEEQLKAVKAEQERLFNERMYKELSLQRESLERARLEAVQKEQAKAFEDRQKLEKKLDQLQRQIQSKTAEELGEGAEVDLYEALREAFRDDRIKRIDKGIAGADIWQQVVYNGESCGCIVYDSKNHSAWRSSFVTKLREDQLAAKADHAVLATRAFPAGKQQLEFQDGVLIANPARVVTVVTLLREHIVQAHRLRLSGQAREEKTAALYEFIASERCSQLFAQFDTLAQDLSDLEVSEKNAHERTWRTRAQLIRNLQKVIHGQLRSEIQRIIEAGTSS